VGAIAHRGEKETMGAGCRCEHWQQREGVLAAVSSRSRTKGIVHQDRAGGGKLRACVVEHCLWLIAAPVVRVDRPMDELQPESLSDTMTRLGAYAPRGAPQPRTHPDALQRLEGQLTVVLKLCFGERSVTDVTVTVKLYVVSASKHFPCNSGFGQHSLADHEERRHCVAALELFQYERRPGRVGTIIEGEAQSARHVE
jgi:hypothetical protein